MAAYDLEEQERIAAIKDWWEKWGVWVISALVAFVLGIAATQGWKYYQKQQTLQAETLFESVKKVARDTANTKEWKKLSDAATAIAEKHPSTFYASEAQLMAAKAAFDAGDLATAKTHLTWAADKGRDLHKSVAKIRLAGVLLDEKKYDEALKTLESVSEVGFAAQVADLKGDIYAAQGRRDEARAAYEVAVEKAEQRNPMKTISQAKLDAFGGATEKPADKNKKSGRQKKPKELASEGDKPSSQARFDFAWARSRCADRFRL